MGFCRCWVTLLQCTVICEACKNSLVMVLMPMHVWWIWQFIVLVKYNLWCSRKLIDYHGVDGDVGLQFTLHCSLRDLHNIRWLWMVLMPKLGCTVISVTCKNSLVEVLMPMLDHFGKSRKLLCTLKCNLWDFLNFVGYDVDADAGLTPHSAL